jgi:hypothetical protein
LRRFLKFLHTMGAVGLMGSLACLLVLAKMAPPPASLAGYALIRAAMADIASYLVLPSLVLTLIPGMLALGVTRAFHDAGWVWAKAATGILIFAGGLHALAPIQEEARLSAEAARAQDLAGVEHGEIVTLWVLLFVSTANVVLGVWRPRLMRSLGRDRKSAAAAE